jgi:iduronate 2-sulfatase
MKAGRIACVAACLCMSAGVSHAAADKPNILFVISDDLTAESLACYGNAVCKTPHIDTLASRGVTFTRAYCQFPVCGASRASILSGLYPWKTTWRYVHAGVSEKQMTLPQCFREQGYWTGRVGKIYHMGIPVHSFTGHHRNDHVADWVERYSFSAMESLTPGKAEDLSGTDSTPLYDELRTKWKNREFGPDGTRFTIPGDQNGNDFVVVEADGGSGLMVDGMGTDKALELLRERAGRKTPFFLAVGFIRPHLPFVAPREYFKGYDTSEIALARALEGDLDDIPEEARVYTNEKKWKLDALRQKKAIRGYYASVSFVDAQVGRLMAELDRLALRDKTIVVFTSDHGFHLGEHDMWQKMSLMEESARVPLIISAPGKKKGERCTRIVELVDLFPTLTALAGWEAPDFVQGRSIAALLDDPQAAVGDNEALIDNTAGFCLRTDRWAYMFYSDFKTRKTSAMLYDMEKDPGQYHNLSGKPGHAAIEKELNARLRARLEAIRPLSGPRPGKATPYNTFEFSFGPDDKNTSR